MLQNAATNLAAIMSKCPHIYRRGNVLYFRIAVPDRFQLFLRVRELTQSLRTQSMNNAVPSAYKLASEAKTLFNYLDSLMAEKELTDDFMQDLIVRIEEARQNGSYDPKRVAEEARKENAGLSLKALVKLKRMQIASELQEERHQEELRLAILQAKAEALDKLDSIQRVSAPQVQREPIKTSYSSKAPMLSDAIDDFLEQYDKNKAAMLKKHRTTLPRFLASIGDKPIDQVKHIDVSRYAATLAEHHNSNFKNYKSSMKQFVEWGQGLYEDAFTNVNVSSIKYSGSRVQKEEAQRSFKDAELIRLFTGNEMKAFCASGADVHKFWLPVLGLYTGARVNEICQLNPAADIKQGDNGVWYFDITSDSATAIDVKKSVKTAAGNRIVPVHSKLIKLGLLDYVEAAKMGGHKILFPQWKVVRGRAGDNPSRWFVRFLDDIGLKHKEGDKKLAGMHAFRKTVLTQAYRGKFIRDMLPIIGHESGLVDETGKGLPAVTLDYIDAEAREIPLSKKKETIEQLKFDIAFYTPVKPVFKKIIKE